jgi:hypothetical protein
MKLLVSTMFVMSCASGSAPPAKPVATPAAPATQPAAPAGPAVPDTPAGKTLQAWLDVFNSGDEARMQAFGAQHHHPQIVDAGFRKQTGGFELLGIEKSSRLELRFLVKEKAGPTKAVGWLTVKDGEPAEIASLQLLAIPKGMTAADMDRELDAEARGRVIDGAIAKLTELYVFPDVAKKMEQALREHQKSGAYDSVVTARAFATLLTQQLQAVSRDKHLSVSFAVKPLPEKQAEPSEADKAKFRAQLEQMNCGFQKAEKLDGNIGYIKFDMFGDTETCGPKATAAFAAVGDVDALIFDLRENGGGQPEMVAFVTSYLFAKRTHLNDIYERKDNKTTEYWTKPDVPGKKLAKQPVFVLTSKNTFSGAEEFAYNLKNLKRATIVGETTGGGAHPTRGARIDAHFMIGVPFARAINPITKTNWEGTGVEPDVKVAAADALDEAKKLAAERVKKKPRK